MSSRRFNNKHNMLKHFLSLKDFPRTERQRWLSHSFACILLIKKISQCSSLTIVVLPKMWTTQSLKFFITENAKEEEEEKNSTEMKSFFYEAAFCATAESRAEKTRYLCYRWSVYRLMFYACSRRNGIKPLFIFQQKWSFRAKRKPIATTTTMILADLMMR